MHAPAGRPLLVLVAPGLGIEMLAAMPRTAGALATTPWTRLPSTAALDPLDAWCDNRAFAQLADLGVAVDRRSLTLPAGPRDFAALRTAIHRRPTGPAPVTIAVATDLLLAARRTGVGEPAWLAAQQRADLDLAELLTTLRRGDLPELWLVATGAPRRVQHTVDVVTALRRAQPPFAGRSRVLVQDGAVRILAADQHTADCWWQRLQRLPFCRVGIPRRPASMELQLLARAGIAFGRRRVAARAPHADEAVVHVALPATPTKTPLTWSGLLAGICARAAELAPARELPPIAPAIIAAQVAPPPELPTATAR